MKNTELNEWEEYWLREWSTHFLAWVRASESASDIPLLRASCRIAMCFSRACVGHVTRICSRNSQHSLTERKAQISASEGSRRVWPGRRGTHLRIVLDLELRFCVMIGMRRGACVWLMMKRMQTVPAVAMILALLGISPISIGNNVSAKRSKRDFNCCDRYLRRNRQPTCDKQKG